MKFVKYLIIKLLDKNMSLAIPHSIKFTTKSFFNMPHFKAWIDT